MDDVPRVPVGPELRQPGRVPGDARHHVRPGQPRHRRAAARRGAVPVEADGHRLPEPAGGPPAGAGVPRADPAGRARPGAEGRGDRQPGHAGAVPRRARPVPPGVRPGLRQPAHGDAVVDAGHPRRPPGRASALAPPARTGARPPGSPTCAATTTSAGRYPTPTPRRSGSTASATAVFSTTSTPVASPGRSRRGALFQENPATGDARICGSAASLCGIESALAAGDDDELTARHAAAGVDVRRRLLVRRHPADLHGRRAGHAQRPAVGRGPGARATTTGGCTGRRWTGRWPTGAATRTRWRARLFAAIRALADARRSLLALRSGGNTEILPTENRSVLAYRRAHPRSAPFLSLTNFSDVTQPVDAGRHRPGRPARPRRACTRRPAPP